MQLLKINSDGTIIIPKLLRSIFKPSDKIAWFVEADTLILKKLNPPKLSELAGRVKEQPLPLKDIVKEVHAYRKGKREK